MSLGSVLFLTILISTGLITLIVAPFFIYAVLYKSNQQMSTYRALMIAYIPFSAIVTITISTTVPFYDRSMCRFYFYGFVPFADAILSSVIADVIFVSDFVITDLLLIILINRYDTVSKHIVNHDRAIYNGIYAFIISTSILQCVIMFLFLTYSLFPPHIAAMFTFLEDTFVPVCAVYQFTRITGFIAVVYLNVKFGIKYASTSSSNVVRLHKMLTKTVVANVISTMVFSRLPMISILVSMSFTNPAFVNIAVNGALFATNFSFLCDMCLTLYFVAPYRRFVAKLLKKRTTVAVVMVPTVTLSHYK